MGYGPIEPSADARTAAHAQREMYLALVMEGFTADQALVLLCQMIAASAK